MESWVEGCHFGLYVVLFQRMQVFFAFYVRLNYASNPSTTTPAFSEMTYYTSMK